MLAIMERNLRLFFKNKIGVLFSVLGALIVLGLYIVFLKQGMIADWRQLQKPQTLLDPWLIGGMLTVTALTSTLSAVRQYVEDRVHVAIDFEVTPVSEFQRQLGYGLSAVIIGIVMQLAVLVVDVLYFGLSDHVYFNIETLFSVVGLIVINAVVAALLNIMLVVWVKSVDTLSTIETIVGTAGGFLTGIYIPIGSLPHFAQILIKLYPGAYSASIYRRVLMNKQLSQTFRGTKAAVRGTFEKQLGVGYQLHGVSTNFEIEMSIFIGFGVLAIAVIVAKSELGRLRKTHVRYN